MARLSRQAKRHTARLKAAARAQLLLSLKRRREPFIAMTVLRALASSNLPPEKSAYAARLKELEGV
jgi:hypothetical protein